MTQHSNAEIDQGHSSTAGLPLSDRPLVADEQNTVIATGLVIAADTHPEAALTATAQEIRDRLFAAPGSAENPECGLQIAHFEIEERIGTGGMGAVFRAMDLQLSRYVALKILHPGIAADPSLVARFRNEARAAAQLNHDNIARVFFTGEQDGVHYIAYEFADGKTIKELITERGKVSVEETINYAIQTTLALIHINAAGIVHRDIKPSNIILTTGQRIKVVDLGLARRDTTDSIGDLTVAGTTLGTFDYISPEQARDPSSADIRSDIYSLGCSIYHMLTGQPPYPEGTALQKLLDHQGKSPPDPRTISAEVPAQVSAIVRRMMETNPELRYQDPGQLLADLISLATVMGLRSVPAEGIIWRRIPVRRVRELSGSLFLTGAVLAICLTALAMHLFPSHQPVPDRSVDEIFASMRPVGAIVSIPEPSTLEVPAGTTIVPKTNVQNETASENGPLNSGATEGAVKPSMGTTESVAVPEPNVLRDPFQLLSADGTRTPFTTLTAAWETAKSGDVILLDFEGPFAGPVRSMPRSRESRSIEIRAAVGRRPLLEFSGDAESSNPGQFFHLHNDMTLTVSGVDLRLRVPEETTTDQWTLFECVGPNRVYLRQCTIDVINPARQNAAVARATDAAVDASTPPETSFRMSNVVVRGSCDLTLVSGQTAFNLSASECGFALDGSLVNNRGSIDMVRPPGQVDVELVHTTCILSQAAFQMEDSDSLSSPGNPERTLPMLAVNSHSNVFAALTPGRAFVVSQGNAYLQELEDLFSWTGSYNLYYQFDHLWDLKSATFDIDSDLLTFDDWSERWQRITDTQEENAREFTAELWKQPDLLSERTRTDIQNMQTSVFELRRQAFFSSEGGSRYRLDDERRIPGASVEDLPQFPVDDVVAKETALPLPVETTPPKEDSAKVPVKPAP